MLLVSALRTQQSPEGELQTSTRSLLPMVVTALLLQAAVAAAQPAAPAESPKPTPTPAPEPAASRTQHTVQIGGEVVRYTATAGWLIMKDDAGKPIARFGYTAYTRDGVADIRRRPLTFAFNGGPGSSSIWLHMGVLGPRRIVVNDPGYAPPPPSERVDNPYSVLDVTDMVMIDPIGTGFSKALGEAKDPTSTESTRTSARWARSSSATSRRTRAGPRRSTSSARATAGCARPASPTTCSPCTA